MILNHFVSRCASRGAVAWVLSAPHAFNRFADEFMEQYEEFR